MDTPKKYVLDRLGNLKIKTVGSDFKNPADLVDFLYKAIMSKKFRKYSVNPEYQKHIRSAIELNVRNGEPIKIAIAFGGYKLWRFEESPEPDWAELFSMIYYAYWLKPIADAYKPGVWFDFYSDDVIVKHIDNIPREDTEGYCKVFREILAFMKRYLPGNMNFTLNRVGEQYASEQEFLSDVEAQKRILIEKNQTPLTEEQKGILNLNVRLNPGQERDPEWREKVQLMHDAYMLASKRRPYYRVPDKIVAITKKLDNAIAVGTTKTSIAKFWAGVGALKRQDNNFIETILTPAQLASVKFTWEPLTIDGLNGKNFTRIRIT